MKFNANVYHRNYQKQIRRKARLLKYLYEIFKKNAKILIKAGLSEKEREILKEVESLVDLG